MRVERSRRRRDMGKVRKSKDEEIKRLVAELLPLLALEEKNKLIGFLKAQIFSHTKIS